MRVALVAFGAAVLIGVGSIGVGLAAFRPALSLSGSTNVAWGQSISLYGSHFIPGGIVVLTLDGTQPLYYADREPAIQVSSNTNTNAAAGLAMLVPQISQIDTLKDTLVVSANGTFNVTINVNSNWPVGHHTIRATEKLSQRSAVLNFSVQQLGQAPTSAPTLSPTDTPTLSPTDPPSLTHTPTPVRRPSPTAIPSPTDPPSPTASVAGLSCVTPTAITLTADQGSNQPGSEKVTLCASGSGLLNWTASWDQNQAPWLQLDHSSGQIQAPGQGQVTISAKANGLKLGKYTTTVTFSSQPGTSTVSLAATFTVQASTAVTPTTTADPSPSPTPTPTAAPSPSPTTTPTVTISKPGTDLFFPSSTSDNAFTATPGATPAFSQTFPVINFNPPSGTVSCSNTTNVDVNTRPFTDVVPQSDGSCQTIVAQGNGEQAGVGNLEAFDAVFTATITVSQASQVTFNFYSDDGWILSMGTAQDNKNAQPTYVSGPMNNPPSKGPFTGYSVVGSYNNTSAPAQNNLVVNFPAAGTYPFELDYFETELGQLALTLTANGQPIQLATPTPSLTSAAVTPTPTAVSAAPPSVVLDYGASGYRYEVVQTGASQGFQDPAYDDSAFQVGSAAFGTGVDGCPLDSTINTAWSANTDILVRRVINLPAGTSGLTVHVAIDNDAVVYWNGVQIGSTVLDGCAARDTLIATVPNSAVLGGNNVLAIRGTDRGGSTYLDLQVRQG